MLFTSGEQEINTDTQLWNKSCHRLIVLLVIGIPCRLKRIEAYTTGNLQTEFYLDTLRSFLVVLKLDAAWSQQEGHLRCELNRDTSPEDMAKAAIVFNTMIAGLTSLQQGYPKSLKFSYREV